MNALGNAICKYRKIILIIALILLIPAAIGMKTTKINYDILVYLPEDIETVQAEKILSEDFNMGGFSVIILENMKNKDILELESKIKEIDNVEKVVSIADVIGTELPKEMLPNKVQDMLYDENKTIMLVTFKDQISSEKTINSVEKIREVADERCKISGMTATLIDTRNLSNSEIVIYVVIAVALCLIILQLALDSYVVPFLLLINIGIAVLYNMGTNIFLGEISYITKAISAVLQLGVTMDFAIFLYHSYIQEKSKFASKEEAMANAIKKTFTSVLGSSLTTIAGFLALCSMNLSLGKDIGIVMAKGVLFGVISVVTILPALILECDKLIEKTKHKEILPKFTHIRDFIIKHYVVILILFVAILPIAFFGYKNTNVYYKLDKSLPESLSSIQANKMLKEDFNMTSMEMLLVDKDLPEYKTNEMIEKIEKMEGIEWVIGYSKLGSSGIPKTALPQNLVDIFQNDKYQIILINSNYEIATNELNAQVKELTNLVKEYDENAVLAGEGPLMSDLVQIADHDFNSVTIISISVIFIIMLFVLKSVSLPVILITVIEFAIFINMGISYYTNVTLPFVASIVIGTIQLGATIDYAILITNKYIVARKEGKNKKEAAKESLGTSIASIVVSGLCFFGATFGVGVYSKIEMISSLCALMARGAIISVLTVICALPSFLIIFDKIICKTTIGMKNIKEEDINDEKNSN